MEIVDNLRETVFRKLLILGLQETKRYSAYERSPARIAAEGADDAVADGEGVQVEYCS